MSEDDVAKEIPCGPDVETHLAAIERWAEAGFDYIAIVPLGKVERFFELWKELAPALPQEARSGASPASIAER